MATLCLHVPAFQSDKYKNHLCRGVSTQHTALSVFPSYPRSRTETFRLQHTRGPSRRVWLALGGATPCEPSNLYSIPLTVALIQYAVCAVLLKSHSCQSVCHIMRQPLCLSGFCCALTCIGANVVKAWMQSSCMRLQDHLTSTFRQPHLPFITPLVACL